MTVSPRVETLLTGVVTLVAVVIVGIIKQQGWLDSDYANIATGMALGGGGGWAGKTVSTSSAPPEGKNP